MKEIRFLLKHVVVLVSSALLLTTANAQTFWDQIEAFPGKPKTGIAISEGTCLFVGLDNGIIVSCNEGEFFEQSITTEVIFTVFAARNGDVYAGGAGKIYYTRDLGVTWDSVSLGSIYPITQFAENSGGDLYAITGALDIEKGFVGDGVYYSEDNGLTWEARNTGLGIYRSCERIAVDKNDRVYLCLADEFVTGDAGLFISDDNGMSWGHITITIDGQGVVDNTIKIANTLGLAVSPKDSLYFSFSGTAVNAGVTLNTCKHK